MREKHMTSVDVAVPCYQYGRYLRDAVTSVLNQDVPNLRVVIIDNASSDNSLEVARELMAQDSRVELIAHSTNLGQHASFNEAIDWAKSKYFALLCADDLLVPGSLSRAISVMEKHPDVHLTYGKAHSLARDRNKRAASDMPYRVMAGRQVLERLCREARCFIRLESVLVRTAVQKRVGYYRSVLPHTDDYEMWMRFACLGSVAEIEAVQGLRRNHPQNRCTSVENVYQWDLHYEAALESFFANEGALVDERGRLRRMARRALAERAYWGSLANLIRGDVRLSLALMRFAVTRSPQRLLFPPLGYFLRRVNAPRKIWRVLAEGTSGLGTRS
jgi:glycosyltransferase involved in cell wall biosynthesis